MNPIEVKIGQIWCDCFNPAAKRCLVVTALDQINAECVTLRTGKGSRIRKDRVKPGSRGYRFVVDSAEVEEVTKQWAEYRQRQAAKESEQQVREQADPAFLLQHPTGGTASGVRGA